MTLWSEITLYYKTAGIKGKMFFKSMIELDPTYVVVEQNIFVAFFPLHHLTIETISDIAV